MKKTINKQVIMIIILVVINSLSLVGCEILKIRNNDTESSSKDNIKIQEIKDEDMPIASINVKDYGVIEVKLYPNIAPNTVNNFIDLANSGFYNGLTFHRIIKDFMIQGGCPSGNGKGGPGYRIKGEFTNNGFENELKHEEGVISMARSKNPDSAGSQFFIVTKESPHLDKEYAAFGKVISGIDIIHKIEDIEVNKEDKPLKPIVIESIKVDTKNINYHKPVKLK